MATTKTYTRKPRNLGINKRLKGGATLLHVAKNPKAKRLVTMVLQKGSNVKFVNVYTKGKPARHARVDAIARSGSMLNDRQLVRAIAATGFIVFKSKS